MDGVSLPVARGGHAREHRIASSNQGLTDDEVARAKRQLRARLVFETDSVTNIAHQIGYFETVTGPGFFETIRPAVPAVTTAQVADVARKRLTAGRPDGRLVSARWSAMTTGLTSGLSPVRHVLRERRGRDRAADGVLAGGHDQRGRPRRQPERARRSDRAGVVAARVIDRGTTTRSADEIAEVLDDRGVTLRVSTNRHVMMLSCTCLSEDFPDVLAVVADVARKPVFPADEVEKRRDEMITAIRQDLDNPGIRAARRCRRCSTATATRTAVPRRGRSRSWSGCPADDLHAFHRGIFRPSPRRWSSSATSIPIEAFGASTARSRGGTRRRRRIATCRRWRVTSTPAPCRHCDAGQAAVRHRVRLHHDQPSRSGVLQLLGDEQHPRPVRARRTARGEHPRAAGDGVLRVQLVRSEPRARAARDTRRRRPGQRRARDRGDRRRGRSAGRRGPTERELLETRQFLIGSIPRMLETNQSIATFLQTSEFFGLGLDYDRQLPRLLEAVTLDGRRRRGARRPPSGAGVRGRCRPRGRPPPDERSSHASGLLRRRLHADSPGAGVRGDRATANSARGMASPSTPPRSTPRSRPHPRCSTPTADATIRRSSSSTPGGSSRAWAVRGRPWTPRRAISTTSGPPAITSRSTKRSPRCCAPARRRLHHRAHLEHAAIAQHLRAALRARRPVRGRDLVVRPRVHEAASQHLSGSAAARRRDARRGGDGGRQLPTRHRGRAAPRHARRSGRAVETVDGLPARHPGHSVAPRAEGAAVDHGSRCHHQAHQERPVGSGPARHRFGVAAVGGAGLDGEIRARIPLSTSQPGPAPRTADGTRRLLSASPWRPQAGA